MPDGAVVVSSLPDGFTFAVDVRQHGESVESIDAVDGSITLPSRVFQDAFINRLSLVLQRDGVNYLGIVFFLPVSESEPYDINEYIMPDGTFVASANVARTDFVSVEDVTEFVVTGTTGRNPVCAAYDEEFSFVKILIDGGAWENVHLVPDGSYSYIVATGRNESPRSCLIYYRSRKKRTKNN